MRELQDRENRQNSETAGNSQTSSTHGAQNMWHPFLSPAVNFRPALPMISRASAQ